MTIDERIEKLADGQVKIQQSQAKNETILATILDSIKRLERIAVAHAVDIDDLDVRLTDLENRRRRRPQ